MNKIGLGLDYNNICKDYNTVYLDRDNNDLATKQCMAKVMDYFKEFFADFMQTFEYELYRLSQPNPLLLKEIVQKRFFFYSLEKEIIAQTFVLQNETMAYNSLSQWSDNGENSLLIQNDDEGEGIYFYFVENSDVHKWLVQKLSDCSLDEIPFEEA